LTDVLEVLTAYIVKAIALKTEAVITFETSVYFYGTLRRNIPEGCHLVFSAVFTWRERKKLRKPVVM
jgi:hypothetical protein